MNKKAMTKDAASTTETIVDVSGITKTPENLRDTAARVDQALAANVGTFEERAERLRNAFDGITDIQLSAHERTRLMLQVAYGDCLYAVLTDQGCREFAKSAKERNVPNAKEGENLFLPVVKTIWGKYVEKPRAGQSGVLKKEENHTKQKGKRQIAVPAVLDGAVKPESEQLCSVPKTVWVHNRSAEKYAGVFRHLFENKVELTKVALYIETYNHTEHGTKLNGIVAADSAAHGGKGSRSAFDKEEVKRLIGRNGLKALSTVEKPQLIKATEGPVVLLARIVDGRLELLGDLEVAEAVINVGVTALAQRLSVPPEDESKKAAEEFRKGFENAYGDLNRYKEAVAHRASEGPAAA